MSQTSPYRVVQWTTGNVGKSSVAAIARNPTLELVGCYAWSPDKAGKDVGELVGIDPLGVTATNDVQALLALKPDVVVYNPMWIDVDELVEILSAGVNVVATTSFVTVTVVTMVGGTLASAAPTPGGVGAVEAALIGGLAAFGVPAAIGVPAVLLYRVLTCWLPVFIGWPVMRWLTKNEMI